MNTAPLIHWFGEGEDSVDWRWWLDHGRADMAAFEIPQDTDVSDLDGGERAMLGAWLRRTGKRLVYSCHACGRDERCGHDAPRAWLVIKEGR